MAAPSEEAPCGLCGAAAAPYTCPRCNRRLCSLGCYRSHGACAEAFYREQVLQTLEAERGSPPGRDRLDAAFRRLRELREAEDPAGPAGRDLWESLSPAERAGFQRLLSSGEAAALLPPWRPWWWRRGRPRLPGNEDEEDEEDEEAMIAPPPPLPASIPSLSSFPGPPPSPLLPFQLPNVLYGYAFALSLHGGDEALLPELPAAAIAVSAALRARCPFASTAEAVRHARHAARHAGCPPCPLGDAGTVLAVAQLLEGDVNDDDDDDVSGVAMALGHLERLLRKGSRVLAGEERRRFGRAARKCRYLLAWSRGAAAAVAALAGDARRLHATMAGLGSGGRRLVEELD